MENVKALPEITAPLVSWYRKGHRDLPWRNTRDPYAIWVSEIMLQQTRAEAVKPYYHAFLSALPTVGDLATVEDDVLNKLWQGLGYYSRARNLRRAAVEIMGRFGGEIPKTKEELLTLPGIGSYTAGSIASIAFDEAVPAVDGNVLRVLSRILCDDRNILDPKLKGEYETLLLPHIPKSGAGEFTQALIELGATHCGPNAAPNCEDCPLYPLCKARKEGKTREIPYRAPKKKRKWEQRAILVVTDGVRTLLHKRGEEGLLSGLYEFPSIIGNPTPNEVYARLEELGVTPLEITELPPAKHIFTHIEWHMTGLLVKVEPVPCCSDTPCGEGLTYVWASREGMQTKYSIPSAFRAFVLEK